MEQNKEEEEFNNVILKLKGGILFCEYKEDIIDLSKAKKIIVDRHSYTNGVSFPALIKSMNKIEIDKSARSFFKSEESSQGLTAIALMSTNSYSLIMMNFMIRLYRPSIPIKMFTNQEKAIEWLSNFTSLQNE